MNNICTKCLCQNSGQCFCDKLDRYEAYQQGRADAIDDFARAIKPYIAEYRSAIKHNRYAFIDVNNIAEQLKEQENE